MQKFQPYAGNGKPFLYAAFASSDREAAQSVCEAFVGHGYAVWPSARFDRRRIDKAALVVLFLTPEGARNETLDRAMQYAVMKDKAMLVVHLAPTSLSPTQQLMLNTLQGILRYDCASDDAFYEKLYGSAVLQNLTVTPAQKHAARRLTWFLCAGVVAVAAAAVLLTIRTNATVPEDSLAAQLGYTGRINDISSICIYGQQTDMNRSESSFAGTVYNWDTQTWSERILFHDAYDSSGFGDISDISDFAQLKNLTELSLAGNQVSDITPLFQLHKLEYLDIAGNPVSSIDGIEELTALTTLCIANTQISDLSPLDACRALKTVYVDVDQYAAFADEGAGHAYSLVKTGPKEELRHLSVHIFGGVEDNGDATNPYSVFVQTQSWHIYDDYTYTLYKNGVPLRVYGQERLSSVGEDFPTKLHLLITIQNFGRYDTDAKYTLVVQYGDYSATYQVWHKYDDAHLYANGGQLIDESGF